MSNFLIELEAPIVRAEATGTWLSGRGWALANSPVEAVTVFVGQDRLCQAVIGGPSPEAARAHPDHPEHGRAGFFYAACITAPAPPSLELRFRVEAGGEHSERSVTAALPRPLPKGNGTAPNPASSRPSGAPDVEPMLLALETATLDARGALRVGGWVVSLAPVEEIAVFLGPHRLGLARKGIVRDDVGKTYSKYPNAKTSGFLFVEEVPHAPGLLGTEPIRVVAIARGGAVCTDSIVPTISTPAKKRGTPASEPDGQVYCDAVVLTNTGELRLEGWAICRSGLAELAVDLDDTALGKAEIGLERPDVGSRFPAIPLSRSAGFRLSRTLGRPFSGEHVVVIAARGRDGEELVVRRPVQVHAALTLDDKAAPAPFAPSDVSIPPIRFFIDTPLVQGGTATERVRGSLSLNGWAIATAGIESIEVFVDGMSVGQAYHGTRREDIQAAFPDIPGALRCGFGITIPPHFVKPGSHEVSLVFRDRAGGTIDSRFRVDAERAVEEDGPWRLRAKVPLGEVRLNREIVKTSGVTPEFALVIRAPGTAADTDARLMRTLGSLERQVWDRWRAVVLAAPAELEVLRQVVAERFGNLANRLEVAAPGAAGSGLASLAPESAQGSPSFFVLLTAGDELGCDAVMELAVEASMHPGCDLIYSDERRRDPADGVLKAFFKPDWSPNLHAGTNYIGRIWAARRELLERTGATVESLTRHGEYDLVLQLTEAMTEIRHVARVLCERGSRDLDAPAQELRALERAGRRRGREGKVLKGCVRGTWRTVRPVVRSALVSIIIPTMGARDLIRLAIASIRGKTAYRHFEIVCLDNIPVENMAAKAWLKEQSDAVVPVDGAFNWSQFNNAAAAQAKGEFLLFLNDDVEVTDPAWLETLVEIAARPEVGVVGPLLLYPDRKIQHGGMFLAENGIARHAFRFAPSDEPGPFGLALTQRDVSSVTGACMMVRRSVFTQLGGFAEEHQIVNNDVDFCLRAGRAGYQVLYTPEATLIHHEMASREQISDIFHKSKFLKDWGLLFARGDPFFHHRLARTSEHFLPDSEPIELLHIGHPLCERDKVKRILVVKVDHIGDFLTAIPAIRLLKRRFPQAGISVLCARASLPIAGAIPEIQEAIEFNLYHARSDKGTRKVSEDDWAKLRTELASRHFDIAIDLRLHPDTRSILTRSGADFTAGFTYRGAPEGLDIALEWEGDSARVRKRSHIVDRFCELVEAVAVAVADEREQLSGDQFPPARPEILARLSAFRQGCAAGSGGTLVCIHPGVGNSARQWPSGNFATLVDMFAEFDGAGAVLIGSPDEAKVARRVLAQVRRPDCVMSLVGETTVSDLPGVLLACDLYVGNNSGPQHLAAALGLPTLGIHSGVVDATEWGPFGSTSAAIRRRTSCSPCYLTKRSDCHRNMECLDDLRPGSVYDAAKRLLAARRSQRNMRPPGSGL